MSLLQFKYKHTHTNTQGFIVAALVSGTLDCLGSFFPADRPKSSNIFAAQESGLQGAQQKQPQVNLVPFSGAGFHQVNDSSGCDRVIPASEVTSSQSPPGGGF